jgi:hypothetical protein
MVPRHPSLACEADRRLRPWEMQRFRAFFDGANSLGTALDVAAEASDAPLRSDEAAMIARTDQRRHWRYRRAGSRQAAKGHVKRSRNRRGLLQIPDAEIVAADGPNLGLQLATIHIHWRLPHELHGCIGT